MILSNDYSDDAVLKEIGSRITQYRLNQDITQAALALEAGVSNRTMARAEQGHSVQASSLISYFARTAIDRKPRRSYS